MQKTGVEQRLKWAVEKHFATTEEEPLFDAADVYRDGRCEDYFPQH